MPLSIIICWSGGFNLGAFAARPESSCWVSSPSRTTAGDSCTIGVSPATDSSTWAASGAGALTCPASSLCLGMEALWANSSNVVESKTAKPGPRGDGGSEAASSGVPAPSNAYVSKFGAEMRFELTSLLPRLARPKHHGSAVTPPASLRSHCYLANVWSTLQSTCSPKAITWTSLFVDFVSQMPLRQPATPFLLDLTYPKTTSPKAQTRPL